MSQITRCPSCGTAFKVVNDQLRISDGWVRCGQCKDVFDASAHLQGPVPAPQLLSDLSLPAVPPSSSPAPVREAGSAPELAQRVPEAVSSAAAGAEEGATDEAALPPSPPVPSFLAASLRSAGVPQAPDWVLEPAAPFGWRTRDKLPSASLGATPPPVDVDAEEKDRRVPETAAAPEPRTPEVDAGDEVPDLAGYELPFAELRDSEWPEDMAGDDSEALSETEVPLPDIERDARDEALVAARGPALLEAGDAPPTTDGDAFSARIAWPEVADTPASEAADRHAAIAQPTAPAELLAEAFEPDFVRAARRKAFWRRPVVRVATGVMGLVLLSTLVAQMLWYERDRVAEWQPGLRPALAGWCAALGCTLAPPRQIADVVIDSSAFNKARGESYQLLLTLKSRAGIALAMPSVELTLTDAQDQPLLRRVLSPADLGAPGALAAHGEWSAAVPVMVTDSSARVAGYRVLAFYP